MSFMYQPDHRVTPLKKHQLQFKYPYGASAGDDPAKKKIPDSVLLNRHEWYEVLYFVNKFANDHGNAQADVALQAERMLQRLVPTSLRSHAHISQWLLTNWRYHPDA